MLKELRLTNIILVESACIAFKTGFNVLSGESGSGKSAIMNALNLIAGDRSDLSILRRGSDKGSVEALFDIDTLPHIHILLEQSGIDHDKDADLIIRRELSTTGKSRAFINNQPAQLSLLKNISALLFDVVGQHANQKLLSLDYHRHAVDLFGSLHQSLEDFTSCFEEETVTRQRLENLINSEAQRLRELEVCHMEIEEITNATLKDSEEEEEIFNEYTLLSNAEELTEKVHSLTDLFDGEKTALLKTLSRQKSTFEQLVKLAPALQDTATAYENAIIELQEVVHTLNAFENRIEYNPQRAEQLSDRLELITRLKRKYAPTIPGILEYLHHRQKKRFELENASIEIDDLKANLEALSKKCNRLSEQLSLKRQQSSLELQKTIISHLRSLNMPKVEFHIEITPQKRNRSGNEKIEFFLTPNVGEHRISLRDCASGGELSRTMLAMQAVLVGKEMIPTLVFDEIDSNIGGETASIVGEKMCQIGDAHQVICITHFPQVAKQASHHLRIAKAEVDGRTCTTIESLNELTRPSELLRMHGGK